MLTASSRLPIRVLTGMQLQLLWWWCWLGAGYMSRFICPHRRQFAVPSLSLEASRLSLSVRSLAQSKFSFTNLRQSYAILGDPSYTEVRNFGVNLGADDTKTPSKTTAAQKFGSFPIPKINSWLCSLCPTFYVTLRLIGFGGEVHRLRRLYGRTRKSFSYVTVHCR